MRSPRFLFFLYTLPPAPGTAPRRNFRITKALAKISERAFILTANAKFDRNTIGAENVEALHISATDYRKLNPAKNSFNAYPEKAKQNVLAQNLIRLINTFPFSILIGEGGLFYYLRLLKKGSEVIKKEKITHLYSSYRPFADHYAAFHLKKKHPRLVWIADFRDLIIDPHTNHLFFKNHHKRFFRRIFSNADILTTVSSGLASHLKLYNSNVVVVRNGIEGDIKIPEPVGCTHFTIVYTGSMFLETRNPGPLFEALQELSKAGSIGKNNVRVLYAGKDPDPWITLARQYSMSDILDIRGVVSSKESRILQQNACINVLLTIASPQLQGVLTGKMIEYFEAGSPILSIVKNQNDPELISLLEEIEIGHSFSDQPADSKAIRDFILKEYLYWNEYRKNRKPVNVDILKMKYSTDAVMRELCQQITNR